MTNEQMPFAWCWADPICASVAVAGLSSAVAIARRLASVETWPRNRVRFVSVCRSCFEGATICGAACFAICLIGVSLWPSHVRPVAGLTILVGVAFDLSSESARAWLRGALMARLNTAIPNISGTESRNAAPDQTRPPNSSSEDTTDGQGGRQ